MSNNNPANINNNNPGGLPPGPMNVGLSRQQQQQQQQYPQIPRQQQMTAQQAAWMAAAASANNNPAVLAAGLNNLANNMNPQQQSALFALQQSVMNANNNNNNSNSNNNSSNAQQQQGGGNNNNNSSTTSAASSSSINPMNLTPKQQQQLQHDQKSQMLNLQQQLNSQQKSTMQAAAAAAAANSGGGGRQQQTNNNQQQQQQQQQMMSSQPHQHLQQLQQFHRQQQLQQQLNNQVAQQKQQQQGGQQSMMVVPPQQQQQQQQGNSTTATPTSQQQQMMMMSYPNNNVQGGGVVSPSMMNQLQQQQGNQQQSLNLYSQQQMMRHKFQQRQLKNYHQHATVTNDTHEQQQGTQSQQQMQQNSQPQMQQQIQQQIQQQQRVIQQMQVLQGQRRSFIQAHQGQLMQQQQQQNSQQGRSMQQGGQTMQQNPQLSQQQQQQLLQQQLSVRIPESRASFQLEPALAGGGGTPNSPSAYRPPSAMRQSASPMRPPSAQPASRQSFTMSTGQGEMQQPLSQSVRGYNSFYRPLKSSTGGGGSRGGNASNNVSQVNQGTVGDQSNDPTQLLYLPTTANKANEVSGTSIHLEQYLPTATPTLTSINNAANESSSDRRLSQSQKSSSTSGPTPSSGKTMGKTATSRQSHHKSPLSLDEVRSLANQLSCEEKIIWVSKQILGTHGSNGFQVAMSNIQRTKRQRARQYKKQHQDDTDIDGADQERLKAETFNARVAEKMISEMNQGLQFCDLMADTIKSILREIDPDNPLILLDSVPATSSLSDPQKDARVSGTMDALSSAVSASLQEPSIGSGGGGSSGAMPLPSKDVLASIMKGSNVNLPHLRPPTNASGGQRAGTVAQDNAQGSTLRKSRKRGSIKVTHADKELVAVIGDHDDNGKKLSKKELSNRLFETTRFRTLHKGDYVAAKLDSRDLWILARVVKQWNAVEVPLKLLLDLSDSKKETLFTEKVLIQEDDLYNEYNGDLSSARAVKRQHIIPLAKSTPEGNEWGKRLRKGSRVYAKYPQTTTLYSATVIDCATYCRNEDDVIIVEFDGDEDEDGNTPQRHILARFVTLVPREFETNAPRKKRKSTSDVSRRIVTTTAVVHPPPIIHQGVANDPSSVSNNVKYDDYILAGLMQPPGN